MLSCQNLKLIIPNKNNTRKIFEQTSTKLLICKRWESLFKHERVPLPLDLQYLQQSPLPTSIFQSGLPNRPVPFIEETTASYNKLIYGLAASEEETIKCNKLLSEFTNKWGKELNAELAWMDSYNSHTSFVAETLMDLALLNRGPLHRFQSLALVFDMDSKPEYNTQLARATNLTYSILRFLRTLTDGLLVPDLAESDPADFSVSKFLLTTGQVFRPLLWSKFSQDRPKDMSEYIYLFGSIRLPGEMKDKLRRFPQSRHIVVFRRGHIYLFNVLDFNGQLLSPRYIHSCLHRILSEAVEPDDLSPAILTSLPRQEWFEARRKLITSPNLQLVESALFCLALDDDVHNSDLEASQSAIFGAPGNRWFDKSFHLVVSQDGRASLKAEPSWGDGQALFRLFTEVSRDCLKWKFVGTECPSPATSDIVHKLEFPLSDSMKQLVTQTKESYLSYTAPFSVHQLKYNGFERDMIRFEQLMPEALIQLAIQLGYYKVFGHAATASLLLPMAHYRQGRTELLPITTRVVRYLCKLFHDKSSLVNPRSTRATLQAWSNDFHKAYRFALQGRGCNRHMLALQYLQYQKYQGVSSLFHDPLYQDIHKFKISSHHLPNDRVYVPAAAILPTEEDGFGIVYTQTSDSLTFFLTSLQDAKSAKDLSEAISVSLEEVEKNAKDIIYVKPYFQQ